VIATAFNSKRKSKRRFIDNQAVTQGRSRREGERGKIVREGGERKGKGGGRERNGREGGCAHHVIGPLSLSGPVDGLTAFAPEWCKWITEWSSCVSGVFHKQPPLKA
jgi:hypothetical protein